MSYAANGGATHAPLTAVSPLSAYSLGAFWAGYAGQPTAAVWPSANRAILCPFALPTDLLALKVRWYNGGGVAGNIDMGVYDGAGTLLLSTGSTAMSGASQWQAVDITDTVLPGRRLLYMAFAASSASASFYRWNPSYVLASFGSLQKDSSFALPATISGCAQNAGYMPVMVIEGRVTR